jgi:hypothetical protein
MNFLTFDNYCKSMLTDCNRLGKLHFWPPGHYHLRKLVIPNSVVNFLHFPVVTRMLKSNKQGRSYDRWNTAHKWKNPEYSFWFGLTTTSQNSTNLIRCGTSRNIQCKSDREFLDLSRKYKYTLIQLTVQELWSLKVGGGVSSGQIELSGQIWTWSPLPYEF